MQRAGDGIELLEDKVGVADDLGRGPGAKHRGVPGADVEGLERPADGPHEEETAGNLHRGGEDGGGNDSWLKIEFSLYERKNYTVPD